MNEEEKRELRELKEELERLRHKVISLEIRVQEIDTRYYTYEKDAH